MPAATVLPPSRTAKPRPSSIAIGLPNSTVMMPLSPGMTISVPSVKRQRAVDIRRPEEELRPVAGEERLVPSTLLGAQGVHLRLEPGVWRHRPRRDDDMTAHDLAALDAAKQHGCVVAGHRLVGRLVERLDARHHRRAGCPQTDDLDGPAHADHALLDFTGHDSAAAADGHDVLDRHEERPIQHPHGVRYIPIDRVEQLHHRLHPSLLAGERPGRRDPHYRDLATQIPVLREQLAHLELDEVEQLGVVDGVGLVERDHDVGHPHLTREHDVLTRLGHGAIAGSDDQDGAIDLGRTGDHVLHVVGVAGHVDVRVVACRRLVLDVGDVDRDATGALLGGAVDLIECHELGHARLCRRPAPW